MSDKNKYVAYVSTYTQGDNHGITIFDVDMKSGRFTEKARVNITNSSYMSLSHDEKYLYAITDSGVASYKVEKDGMLTAIDTAGINGMRGCYLSSDYEDKFLFVAGYHDGKITVLGINPDGTFGDILDEIYHKGWGNVSERNFRPHVNCVKMTRDNKYLCAADLGMDYVNVYELNHDNGRLKLIDIVHSEQNSGPRHIKFTQNGQFMFVVHEIKNNIDVYYYEDVDGNPEFEKVQVISTLDEDHAPASAASALTISDDFNYLISSNAGDNSVIMYEIDNELGQLKKLFCLPISGDYPKDAVLYPDNRHLVSLNHESDTMTFFKLSVDKKLITMCQKEMRIKKPNCLIFHKVEC